MSLNYAEGLKLDQEAMINTIMHWSNINSGTYNIPGIVGMTAILRQAFSVLDCEVETIPLPPIEKIDSSGENNYIDLGSLLRFRKRTHAPTQVLLMGHMDTVFGIDHPFQKAIRLSDNVINGPGVADMKGGLLIMLEALKAFEQFPGKENLGWEVLINPDEEIGSLASSNYLTERAKHHQVGLLFEPAMDEKGTLASDRKGSGKFTFVLRGLAAHAGRDFDKGVSAIYALAKLLSKLESLNGKREKVTFNVGFVQGGGASNVVPDRAICHVDVRTNQADDEKWVYNNLLTIIDEMNTQPHLTVKMFGKFTRKPKVIDAKAKKLYDLVLDVAKGLGQTLTCKPSGGCTDGNNLAAAGLPNVDSLGACGGKIHSDEEYLLVNCLSERVKLCTGILTRLCDKGF